MIPQTSGVSMMILSPPAGVAVNSRTLLAKSAAGASSQIDWPLVACDGYAD